MPSFVFISAPNDIRVMHRSEQEQHFQLSTFKSAEELLAFLKTNTDVTAAPEGTETHVTGNVEEVNKALEQLNIRLETVVL